MDLFIKATACGLVALILYLLLAKSGKDYAVMIALAACSMILATAVAFLKPIIDFLRQLVEIGQFDTKLLSVVLKSVGIGLLSEIVAMICSDSGYGALGKTILILASATILWLSLPLFSSLISLVEEILVTV